MVGPIYCTMPITDRGSARAAAEKRTSGVTVTMPVEASSQKCPGPCENSVSCPCVFIHHSTTSATGSKIKVSSDSDTTGCTLDPTRALSSPYVPKVKATPKPSHGICPYTTLIISTATVEIPMATH